MRILVVLFFRVSQNNWYEFLFGNLLTCAPDIILRFDLAVDVIASCNRILPDSFKLKFILSRSLWKYFCFATCLFFKKSSCCKVQGKFDSGYFELLEQTGNRGICAKSIAISHNNELWCISLHTQTTHFRCNNYSQNIVFTLKYKRTRIKKAALDCSGNKFPPQKIPAQIECEFALSIDNNVRCSGINTGART